MAALTINHSRSLASGSRDLLKRLSGFSWASDLYLAGSAALALYLGHRPVVDVDLMSQVRRLRASERRDLLQDLLALDPQTRVQTARDGFLQARVAGASLRIHYYPYPLIAPDRQFRGMAVASPIDLGLMKIAAIISRGTRRDFIDLFLLCREVPLPELLQRSNEKFGQVEDFPLQALKGLADLSLVDGEPSPALSVPVQWQDVETWIRDQVRSLGRQHVGLA